jgi:ribose transport system permease protein
MASGFLGRIDPQILGIVIFLVLIVVTMTIVSNHFLTFANLFNVLRQSVFVMILAFGMTFVLSSGGIDLSVGSVLGLCGGTTAWLLFKDVNIVVAIMAGLAVGLVLGIMNGLMITKMKIPPFIATLAMLSIASGILYVWTRAIPFREYMKDHYEFFGQGNVLTVPFPVIATVVLFYILFFLFRRMRFGRRTLALGSSEEATLLSGVNVNRLRIQVYALSGLLAAISGIMLASRLTTVHPEMGKGYELEAIAAAVIGGTSLAGGKGNLLGAALGAIVLYLIKNAMNLLNIHPYWETIVMGLVILIAVSTERLGQKAHKT